MTMPLDDSQDPMPPDTVTVSDPVPDEIYTQNNKEAYSEAGLSGEAALDGNSDTRMG
jgi:hypothetical protein